MGWVKGGAPKAGGNGGSDRPMMLSYAPATGELIDAVPVSGIDAVESAVARARRAQGAWSRLSIGERSEKVLLFRDILVDHADELVALLVVENGKPAQEALSHEIMVAADLISHYARHAARILAPRDIEHHLLRHRRSFVHYAPLGVVGIISPWNYPFLIPLGDTAAALIAGNAVVLKPSEVTPLIALRAKELFDQCGLPQDLFQVIPGRAETGRALISARPDKVVFTGSVAVGRKVAAACGEQLIPCTLELGGKAPAIVCADADLERSARALVNGAFANSGQICVSVERVYAHEAISEALTERVVELTQELRQGNPAEGVVDIGAITFPRQIEVCEALVSDAIEKGATLLCGGKRGDGQFFQPTVLGNCSQDMRVMRDETFGPVLPIMTVRSDDEAVGYANDSELGLAAYVFTKKRERGRRLAERIRAGSVLVNDVLSAYAMAEAPFGGVRMSGIGRVHGDEGLRSFCEIRHVGLDRIASLKREPFWFPYSEGATVALGKAMRLLMRSGSPLKKVLELF